MKNRIILFFVLFLVLSCSGNYDRAFTIKIKEYLSEFDKKPISDGLYIIIPMFSCNGCKKSVIESLEYRESRRNIIIILLSETYKESQEIRKRLSGYQIIQDKGRLYSQYLSIEGNYPYIVELINGKVVMHNYAKAGENLKEITEMLVSYK